MYKLQLSDVDGHALPGWLHHDANSLLLEGVPSVDDVTRSFTLNLVVVDSRSGTERLTDQFLIAVTEDSRAVSSDGDKTGAAADDGNRLPRPIRCLTTSAVTTATVVIDAEASAAGGAERATTVRAFARHLDLPASAIRYLAAGKSTLDDSSALVAGVGDAASTRRDCPPSCGVALQWEVGCGNVFAAQMDRLQRLETSAGDGTMSAAVGRGVVGWHVANKKPPSLAGSKGQRRRRAAAYRLSPSATPVVSVIPPTSRPVPTHTVTEPDPTRVPPSTTRLSPVTTTPTVFTTTVGERRRTRRRRTRRPRPGRSTTPVVSEISFTSTTTARPYTVQPPYIEPSVTEFPTTRLVATRTPSLPPPKGRDLHWSGVPLRLDLHANEIVDRPIADGFFEGGSPGRLRLKLLTADGLVVSQWLRLDEAAGRLVGMPLDTHVGRQMYVLEGTDSSGQVARGTVVVDVRRKTAAGHYAAFESTARLGLDYDQFTEDLDLRLDVARKIAGGFGDRDASQLAVTRVARGSVALSWTNGSIPGDRICPMSTLVDIRSRMLAPDGSISPRFREALRPYEILSATMTPSGSCSSASLTPARRATSTRSPEPVAPQKVTDSDLMVNVVVPAVIVAVCVIVAVVIACILIHRRRRAQKASSPDKTVKPGAPVIFASELDDNGLAPPSKPLIGVNGERAPAPPDYLAATTGTPPAHDHRRPLLCDPAAEQMSPLRYHPPPGTAVKPPGVHAGSRR